MKCAINRNRTSGNKRTEKNSIFRTCLGLAAVSCVLVILAGCLSAPIATTATENETVPGVVLQGKVHGGQQPISSASVYLYAVTTSGYGAAATSLLKSPGYVTTDSNGNFSITGDYTCTTGEQVYIYSVGGNPGLGSGTNNTAAGLLAGLGLCSGLSSTTFIMVNEVSTIATAYALAGYATDATHISSSNSALAATGVANAFASITNLETLKTGAALATTPSGNGTVPQATINGLANILAACVNSTGPSSTPCNTLFSNAKNGSTAPTDTATAAINIAHNPGANIATLFGLQTATSPFQPMLIGQPNDFTIEITYTGGGVNLAGISEPNFLAIDGSGNVWVTNYGNNFISKFSPTGAAISPSTGYTGGGLDYSSGGIAIDSSGNAWVAGYGTNNVIEFNSSGSPISGSSGYTGGGLSLPLGLAVDTSGNVWVANSSGNSITVFNSSGAVVSGTGVTGGGLSDPEEIAIDVHGNIWAADSDASQISEFTSSGVPVSGSGGIAGGGLYEPYLIAIDGSGNVWAASETNTLNKFSSSGAPLSGSGGYTGGGLNVPGYMAIDASGDVWVTNSQGTSISKFNSSGVAITGSSGYSSDLSTPEGIAIDGSGNVWVANLGPLATVGFITEFVGAATPVATPVVANLLPPYGSAAVNKP